MRSCACSMNEFDRLIFAHQDGDFAAVLSLVAAMLTDPDLPPGQRLGALLHEYDARMRLGEPVDSAAVVACLRHLIEAAHALPGDALGRYQARKLVARYQGDGSALPPFPGKPDPHPPGERWIYSNESTQLLGAVLEAAAGESLAAYARRRFFAPLGLQHTWLHEDAVGNALLFGDIRTTLRELARFGELVRRGGRWQGSTLVSASWIDEMTRPVSPAPRRGGFGFLWWLPASDCIARLPRQQRLCAPGT